MVDRRPATVTTNDVASNEALGEAIRLLVEGLRPERIYLFGSRARGDWNEDSDYDLMMVVPGPGPAALRLAREAYRAVSEIPIPMDILVWSQETFDRQVPVVASLPATVLREGRLLYAA